MTDTRESLINEAKKWDAYTNKEGIIGRIRKLYEGSIDNTSLDYQRYGNLPTALDSVYSALLNSLSYFPLANTLGESEVSDNLFDINNILNTYNNFNLVYARVKGNQDFNSSLFQKDIAVLPKAISELQSITSRWLKLNKASTKPLLNVDTKRTPSIDLGQSGNPNKPDKSELPKEVKDTPEKPRDTWGVRFRTLKKADDPNFNNPSAGPVNNTQITDKEFYLTLLPAINSTLPMQGSRDVPNVMPGLSFKIIPNLAKFKTVGFQPVFQNLGMDTLLVTMVGAFAGGDGAKPYADPDKAPWEQVGNRSIFDNTASSLAELNSLATLVDSYRDLQEFYNFAILQGVEMEVEINSSKYRTLTSPSKEDSVIRAANGNPKFKAIVKSMEVYQQRSDRTWYTLQLEVSDMGLVSKIPINLNNDLTAAIQLQKEENAALDKKNRIKADVALMKRLGEIIALAEGKDGNGKALGKVEEFAAVDANGREVLVNKITYVDPNTGQTITEYFVRGTSDGSTYIDRISEKEFKNLSGRKYGDAATAIKNHVVLVGSAIGCATTIGASGATLGLTAGLAALICFDTGTRIKRLIDQGQGNDLGNNASDLELLLTVLPAASLAKYPARALGISKALTTAAQGTGASAKLASGVLKVGGFVADPISGVLKAVGTVGKAPGAELNALGGAVKAFDESFFSPLTTGIVNKVTLGRLYKNRPAPITFGQALSKYTSVKVSGSGVSQAAKFADIEADVSTDVSFDKDISIKGVDGVEYTIPANNNIKVSRNSEGKAVIKFEDYAPATPESVEIVLPPDDESIKEIIEKVVAIRTPPPPTPVERTTTPDPEVKSPSTSTPSSPPKTSTTSSTSSSTSTIPKGTSSRAITEVDTGGNFKYTFEGTLQEDMASSVGRIDKFPAGTKFTYEVSGNNSGGSISGSSVKRKITYQTPDNKTGSINTIKPDSQEKDFLDNFFYQNSESTDVVGSFKNSLYSQSPPAPYKPGTAKPTNPTPPSATLKSDIPEGVGKASGTPARTYEFELQKDSTGVISGKKGDIVQIQYEDSVNGINVFNKRTNTNTSYPNYKTGGSTSNKAEVDFIDSFVAKNTTSSSSAPKPPSTPPPDPVKEIVATIPPDVVPDVAVVPSTASTTPTYRYSYKDTSGNLKAVDLSAEESVRINKVLQSGELDFIPSDSDIVGFSTSSDDNVLITYKNSAGKEFKQSITNAEFQEIVEQGTTTRYASRRTIENEVDSRTSDLEQSLDEALAKKQAREERLEQFKLQDLNYRKTIQEKAGTPYQPSEANFREVRVVKKKGKEVKEYVPINNKVKEEILAINEDISIINDAINPTKIVPDRKVIARNAIGSPIKYEATGKYRVTYTNNKGDVVEKIVSKQVADGLDNVLAERRLLLETGQIDGDGLYTLTPTNSSLDIDPVIQTDEFQKAIDEFIIQPEEVPKPSELLPPAPKPPWEINPEAPNPNPIDTSVPVEEPPIPVVNEDAVPKVIDEPPKVNSEEVLAEYKQESDAIQETTPVINETEASVAVQETPTTTTFEDFTPPEVTPVIEEPIVIQQPVVAQDPELVELGNISDDLDNIYEAAKEANGIKPTPAIDQPAELDIWNSPIEEAAPDVNPDPTPIETTNTTVNKVEPPLPPPIPPPAPPPSIVVPNKTYDLTNSVNSTSEKVVGGLVSNRVQLNPIRLLSNPLLQLAGAASLSLGVGYGSFQYVRSVILYDKKEEEEKKKNPNTTYIPPSPKSSPGPTPLQKAISAIRVSKPNTVDQVVIRTGFAEEFSKTVKLELQLIENKRRIAEVHARFAGFSGIPFPSEGRAAFNNSSFTGQAQTNQTINSINNLHPVTNFILESGYAGIFIPRGQFNITTNTETIIAKAINVNIHDPTLTFRPFDDRLDDREIPLDSIEEIRLPNGKFWRKPK
ncbi:hypothetical protein H6G33_10700 [Calothrix sp. FACHB-1219]|uniref:hypothetical protein n=1 Tax=unclassified Calothrix TaxID=2619626 RepID=UPI001688D070|nr:MULTISPECIES: hypothetical protein [unclassified Calothrix]MBD2201817.1 hypothetical protein [Calothrix sp. FACHB-168]MBD2217503.1 hypothetical protein [Calothrix sp. FACHB-1219]